MKKRLIAAAAAGMLLLSSVMGFTAAAGETEADGEIPSVEWSEELLQSFVDEGFAGTIYTIDKLGLELIVPEGLEQRQPTEEEKETDTILVFENEDQSEKIEFVLLHGCFDRRRRCRIPSHHSPSCHGSRDE